MGVLSRFAQNSIWRPYRVQGINTVGPRRWLNPRTANRRTSDLSPPSSVRYSFNLDIGEVALGYHLIARSVTLTDENLFFEYAFHPMLTEEAHKELWLNMFYDADISPPDWNYVGAEGDVQYARPPLEARYAWFDFFRPDYDWMDHLYRRGQPDDDYLRNRIARLTVDMKTGAAQIEK
jgi:hypothetical protein